MKNATFEIIALADFKPADYNPRTMTDEAREGLAESIKANGMLQAIVVNKRTGLIVGGHQRVAALLAAGETHAHAAIVDLPAEDEMALNLALNSERARGRWHSGKLAALLGELAAMPAFTLTRMDTLLAEHQTETLGDDYEPVPGDQRDEGIDLEGDGEAEGKAEAGEDDTKYLRLHYTQEEAEEVEGKLGAFMKERSIPSMTEAVMQLLAEV